MQLISGTLDVIGVSKINSGMPIEYGHDASCPYLCQIWIGRGLACQIRKAVLELFPGLSKTVSYKNPGVTAHSTIESAFVNRSFITLNFNQSGAIYCTPTVYSPYAQQV